jgi:hypothetical protein
MNGAIYVFQKVGANLEQYPNDYTHSIFEKFISLSSCSEQIIIHRDNDLVYYGYTKKIGIDEIIGLCVVFNGVVYRDLGNVAKILSSSIDELIESRFSSSSKSNNLISDICEKREKIEQLKTALKPKIDGLDSCALPTLDLSISKDSEEYFTIKNYADHLDEIFKLGYVSIDCDSPEYGIKTVKIEKIKEDDNKTDVPKIKEKSIKSLIPYYAILSICPLTLLTILIICFDSCRVVSFILLGGSIFYLFASLFSAISIKKNGNSTYSILRNTFVLGIFLSFFCLCIDRVAIAGFLLFLINIVAHISLLSDNVKKLFPNVAVNKKITIINIIFIVIFSFLTIGTWNKKQTHGNSHEGVEVQDTLIVVDEPPVVPGQEEEEIIIEKPVADVTQTPIISGDDTEITTSSPIVSSNSKKDNKTTTSSEIKHNVTIKLSYGEYTGDAINNNGVLYPHGKGKLVFKKESLLSPYDSTKAFEGEYLEGKFERGFIVRGTLYKTDGTKSKLTIGNPPNKNKFADR